MLLFQTVVAQVIAMPAICNLQPTASIWILPDSGDKNPVPFVERSSYHHSTNLSFGKNCFKLHGVVNFLHAKPTASLSQAENRSIANERVNNSESGRLVKIQ